MYVWKALVDLPAARVVGRLRRFRFAEPELLPPELMLSSEVVLVEGGANRLAGVWRVTLSGLGGMVWYKYRLS